MDTLAGDVAGFAVKSFHIFLILLVLVGWYILPKKLLVAYIIVIWAIPVQWSIYNDCIVTMAENEVNPPEVENLSAIGKIASSVGITLQPTYVTGVGLFFASLMSFLAARRLLLDIDYL